MGSHSQILRVYLNVSASSRRKESHCPLWSVAVCGLEAFKFWQGGENAEHEKEAHSRSNKDASSVFF